MAADDVRRGFGDAFPLASGDGQIITSTDVLGDLVVSDLVGQSSYHLQGLDRSKNDLPLSWGEVARIDCLVSEDEDLLTLKKHGRFMIIDTNAFLEIVKARSRRGRTG